ncbi:Hypothetical_protein [Hexamita inflata]|uniref:Hypothetical_protein n=1 Tax=Hexamita inflata TaxID=28002 RepID=A0AA86V2R1_9EUKA|nr:Hypothetical protein HINF_LOCUS61576 [Hexamita inflata]
MCKDCFRFTYLANTKITQIQHFIVKTNIALHLMLPCEHNCLVFTNLQTTVGKTRLSKLALLVLQLSLPHLNHIAAILILKYLLSNNLSTLLKIKQCEYH